MATLISLGSSWPISIPCCHLRTVPVLVFSETDLSIFLVCSLSNLLQETEFWCFWIFFLLDEYSPGILRFRPTPGIASFLLDYILAWKSVPCDWLTLFFFSSQVQPLISPTGFVIKRHLSRQSINEFSLPTSIFFPWLELVLIRIIWLFIRLFLFLILRFYSCGVLTFFRLENSRHFA